MLNEVILVVNVPSVGDALDEAKKRKLPVRLLGTWKGDTLLEADMRDYDKIVQWYVWGGDSLRYTTTYERLDAQ